MKSRKGGKNDHGWCSGWVLCLQKWLQEVFLNTNHTRDLTNERPRHVPIIIKDTRNLTEEKPRDVPANIKDTETGLVGPELARIAKRTVSSASQTIVNMLELHNASLQPAEAADELRKLEDKLWEKEKCITKLRKQLHYQRLQAKEDIQAKEKIISDLENKLNAQRKQAIEAGLKNAATVECGTGKETVQMQASEHDSEAVRHICDSLQKKVGRLIAREMEFAVHPEVQTICDDEREAQDVRKYNGIKVELCRELGLAKNYLSASERFRNMEVTPAQREMHRAKCEESPGLKPELHAVRNFIDRLKEAEEKNGVLRRLVKELQQVEKHHEDERKQLLIRTDTKKLNIHEYFSEMTETLQKREEISSQIRPMLQNAVDLWACKFSQRSNYSNFKTLDQMQQEVKKEELRLNCEPRSSRSHEDRAPVDRRDVSGTGRVGISDFNLLRVLGSGEFGTVFLVCKKGGADDGRPYAMKVTRKATIIQDEKTTECTITERRVLEAVRHCPFLVTLRYAFQTDFKLYLILDYASGGDLLTHLFRRRKLNEDEVRFYISEIILALEHLHKLGIIHRDVKLENILLDSQGHVVLADFGLSKKFLPHETHRTYTCCGTFKYMAPEVIQTGAGYGMAADWWSVGVVTYELFTGVSPFSLDRASDTIDKVFRRILTRDPTIPDGLSLDASDLISKLLMRDPKRRLGGGKDDAEELKRHPFFKGMKWSDLAQKAIQAPFTPSLTNELDVSTAVIPIDSPAVVLPNCGEIFRGYSYLSPSIICSENVLSD
jgi:serine/threonine protein kinase